MTKYIKSVTGKPGSGQATTVFTSGAVSRDYKTAQFFMMMQDKGSSLDEARAYAAIGPRLNPDVNWAEIDRILGSFDAR